MLLKQGKYRRAAQAFTLALGDDQEKDCLVARAQCLLYLGDLESAMQDVEQALELDERYLPAIFWKAECLFQKAEFEEVRFRN